LASEELEDDGVVKLYAFWQVLLVLNWKQGTVGEKPLWQLFVIVIEHTHYILATNQQVKYACQHNIVIVLHVSMIHTYQVLELHQDGEDAFRLVPKLDVKAFLNQVSQLKINKRIPFRAIHQCLFIQVILMQIPMKYILTYKQFALNQIAIGAEVILDVYDIHWLHFTIFLCYVEAGKSDEIEV